KSEEFTGAGAGAAGVPGTASNVPGAQGAAASPREAGDSHTSRTENGTYAFNKILKRTRQPAGRLKRITAAVLVDDAVETMAGPDGKPVEQRRRRSADELRQIEQLAKAAIGFDAQRGDSLAVENLTFRQAPPVDVSRPAAAERVRRVFQDWAGVVRYGVIALLFAVVYFVLLRPVQKQVLLALRELSSRAKLAQKVSEPGKDVAAVLQGGGALLPESEQPAEVKRAVALKRELAEKVKAEPAAASKLIQTWLSPQRGSLASAARREGSET
ncbi:MAG TPA: flagellar M-ring protein FliF C-terminal domain-containing protein, partial [Clostridia bacterium]|nr:flagellar M-ring protein FliF C-terminal domain-containing protein [Clostridia bacterium]